MRQERRSRKSSEVTGKILLVDPNPLDLETYTDILQHFGHEVRMCPSYDEALHLVERDNFDLVIIGESGSQFGGRAVLEQLHTGENRVPSLVLSKNTDIDSHVQALSLGAADCIGKPVPPQRLKHAVDACLLPETAEVGCG
jgi:NtrC-family two-component system response regulator AlgB